MLKVDSIIPSWRSVVSNMVLKSCLYLNLVMSNKEIVSHKSVVIMTQVLNKVCNLLKSVRERGTRRSSQVSSKGYILFESSKEEVKA